MFTAPLAASRKVGSTLIVVADGGRMMSIACALQGRLRTRGHHVDVRDVGDAITPLPPTNYDAIVLGAELGRHRDRRVMGDYVARYRDRFDQVMTGLLVVCGSRSRGGNPRRYAESFEHAANWRPDFAASLVDRPERLLSGLLAAMLCRVFGSRDAAREDDIGQLADAISREVRRADVHPLRRRGWPRR